MRGFGGLGGAWAHDAIMEFKNVIGRLVSWGDVGLRWAVGCVGTRRDQSGRYGMTGFGGYLLTQRRSNLLLRLWAFLCNIRISVIMLHQPLWSGCCQPSGLRAARR